MSEIKHFKYFSILADEVADCSNKEQMPIFLRYVDSDNAIKEKFLEIVHCNTGTTGQALYDKIIDCLVNRYQLDIQNCRGQ